MARRPREVIPGWAHHVTQRGTRRLPVFYREEDYRHYLELLAEHCSRWAVSVLSYCLMPNHVHLIVVPAAADSLSRALGEAHRRYAWGMNRPRAWCGHFWQERFRCCAMDERHRFLATRYVLRNPVRARLVKDALDWPYSSAGAHVDGRPDLLVAAGALDGYVPDWHEYLAEPDDIESQRQIRRHVRSGRPLTNA